MDHISMSKIHFSLTELHMIPSSKVHQNINAVVLLLRGNLIKLAVNAVIHTLISQILEIPVLVEIDPDL